MGSTPDLTTAVRPLAKWLYYAISPLLLKERRLLRDIERRGRLVVLNFHEVAPAQDPHAGPIAPELFDDLLGFLRRRFAIRSFDQLDGAPPDRPVAVISFDDGYRSFVEHAMPILARHGIRANQNVIPAAIRGWRPLTVRLGDLLSAAPAHLLRTLRLPGFAARLGSDDPRDRAAFGVHLSNHLKLRPRAERAPLWEQVEHHLRGVEVRSPTAMMDASDVREAARSHQIGVHSFEHETMAFETMDFFRADLDRCAQAFAEDLRLPMDVYAFPNGLARDDQVEHLRDRGIRHVLLTGDGYSRPGSHVHHRFTMAAPTLRELRLHALGLKAESPL